MGFINYSSGTGKYEFIHCNCALHAWDSLIRKKVIISCLWLQLTPPVTFVRDPWLEIKVQGRFEVSSLPLFHYDLNDLGGLLKEGDINMNGFDDH